MTLYKESLAIGRKVEDQAGVAATLHNMGLSHEKQGRYDEALKSYCDALSIATRLGLAPYVRMSNPNIRLLKEKRPGLSCAR